MTADNGIAELEHLREMALTVQEASSLLNLGMLKEIQHLTEERKRAIERGCAQVDAATAEAVSGARSPQEIELYQGLGRDFKSILSS